MNRGFGFITFETEKAAKKALNYNSHMFYKRKLNISISDNKKTQEFTQRN